MMISIKLTLDPDPTEHAYFLHSLFTFPAAMFLIFFTYSYNSASIALSLSLSLASDQPLLLLLAPYCSRTSRHSQDRDI